MTAHELLAQLRADRAAAQADYRTAMDGLTIRDLAVPQPAVHAALRREQDICTAIIEVSRVLGVPL